MVIWVICGHCKKGYNPRVDGHSCQKSRMAQLTGEEKPVVWVHPQTGEIKYPGRNDADMPLQYKAQGYERKEFTSYHEHQAFCRKNGLVNHRAEGIPVDKDVKKSRFGY